jgi:chromate transporter
MSIGILRAGLLGGLAAFVGFTLPSATALTVAAIVLHSVGVGTLNILNGLKVVAVAVVAQAVWGMAKNLAPDRPRATIAVAAAAGALLLPTSWGQVAVIAVAAVIGWRFLRSEQTQTGPGGEAPVPRWLGVCAWAVFFVLLIGLPMATWSSWAKRMIWRSLEIRGRRFGSAVVLVLSACTVTSSRTPSPA